MLNFISLQVIQNFRSRYLLFFFKFQPTTKYFKCNKIYVVDKIYINANKFNLKLIKYENLYLIIQSTSIKIYAKNHLNTCTKILHFTSFFYIYKQLL